MIDLLEDMLGDKNEIINQASFIALRAISDIVNYDLLEAVFNRLGQCYGVEYKVKIETCDEGVSLHILQKTDDCTVH